MIDVGGDGGRSGPAAFATAGRSVLSAVPAARLLGSGDIAWRSRLSALAIGGADLAAFSVSRPAGIRPEPAILLGVIGHPTGSTRWDCRPLPKNPQAPVGAGAHRSDHRLDCRWRASDSSSSDICASPTYAAPERYGVNDRCGGRHD